MTQIVNSGNASNPRGSEPRAGTMTAAEPTPAPLSTGSAMEKPKAQNRFAELLKPESKLSETSRSMPGQRVQNLPSRELVKPMTRQNLQNDPTISESRGPWDRNSGSDSIKRSQRVRNPIESADDQTSGSFPQGKQTQGREPSLSKSRVEPKEGSPLRPITPQRSALAININASNPSPQSPVPYDEPRLGSPLSVTPGQAAGLEAQPLDTAPEDWRLQLQQMVAAAGGAELFLQQNPSLALLSGRLELIEPAQIPALVAQNPLLQNIVGAPQSSVALETPMPLDQSLQILGLNPHAVQTQTNAPLTVQMSSNDAEAPVRIGEVLQELGLDLPRLTQEGDLLKDNLSVDGLQPYMQRAERLRASLGMPIEMPLPANLSQATPSLESVPITGVPLSKNLQARSIDQDLIMNAQNLPQEPEALLWTQLPGSQTLVPLTVVEETPESSLFLTQTDAFLFDPKSAPKPFDSLLPDSPVPDSLAGPPKTDIPTVFTAVPRAPIVAQDPFLAMSQAWNPNTVQTVVKDELNWQELPIKSPESGPIPHHSLDELMSRQLLQAPDAGLRLESAPAPQEKFGLEFSPLAVSLQDASNSGDGKNSDFSGQNREQALSQDQNQLFMPTTANQAPTPKAFTIQPGATASPLPPGPTQQAMQNIFDNSSMMIKDGGGSIRIDLGSKEMGPLDLALDIHDKTVEIRIITHSSQARDALVQELPRLKESLLQHHLNLDKVEIGLSNSSAWSQSSANGQQSRQQLFESMQESTRRGPQGIRTENRSYRQVSSILPDERIPLHNGLIQVRV